MAHSCKTKPSSNSKSKASGALPKASAPVALSKASAPPLAQSQLQVKKLAARAIVESDTETSQSDKEYVN